MEMNLDIYTHDSSLPFQLMSKNQLKAGDEFTPIEGIRVKLDGTHVRKGLFFPEIINFSIEVGSGVAIGLLSSWIYDWLKGKIVEKLVINHREIEFYESDHIKKIIEETTRREG